MRLEEATSRRKGLRKKQAVTVGPNILLLPVINRLLCLSEVKSMPY